LILALQNYWRAQGCVLEHPYDLEVGAGTFHPATFFGVLGKRPWRAAYVEPSRRPTDGRYGDNPIRMQAYYQYQVILKPAPDDVQELYLKSLVSIGIDPQRHDLRFEKDDWKGPTLGAAGLGWQVVLDGLEISQFTYFQQMGGIELDPISCELTYGTERIAMTLQGVESVWDLHWDETHTYGELKSEGERQFCSYNFEAADIGLIGKLFELHEMEAKRLLEADLIYVAYEQTIKCSHLFNLLDARRAISVTERERFIQRIQALSRGCAKAYLRRETEADRPTDAAAVSA
jgi:glycyl-tRNA synthetase alpha chain